MKKLLIIGVFLNAGFLFAIWQQLSVVAEVGSGAGVDSPCEGDATQYSLDTNADGSIDISDGIYFLSWFFSGTEAPQVCLGENNPEDVPLPFMTLENMLYGGPRSIEAEEVLQALYGVLVARPASSVLIDDIILDLRQIVDAADFTYVPTTQLQQNLITTVVLPYAVLGPGHVPGGVGDSAWDWSVHIHKMIYDIDWAGVLLQVRECESVGRDASDECFGLPGSSWGFPR